MEGGMIIIGINNHMQKRYYFMIGLTAIIMSDIDTVGTFTKALNVAGDIIVGMFVAYGINYLSDTQKEIVICAAIDFDGRVVRGHRHSDCIHTANRMGIDTKHRSDAEGFITSKNRFVDRKEGYELQIAAGIKSVLSGGIYASDAYRGKELYSEDLY